MEPFHQTIPEFQQLLQNGQVQKAYQGIMSYIQGLKNHLKHSYPGYSVSSNLYPGLMDMTYFSFTPPELKSKGLKIAIVFVYQTFCFEVWLSAMNKKIQQRYWDRVKDRPYLPYRLVPTVQGYDSILEHTLIHQPDFIDLDALTQQIERGTLKFIEDVIGILSSPG